MASPVLLRRAILREVSEIEAIEALYRQVRAITAEVKIVRPAFASAAKWDELDAKVQAIIAANPD